MNRPLNCAPGVSWHRNQPVEAPPMKYHHRLFLSGLLSGAAWLAFAASLAWFTVEFVKAAGGPEAQVVTMEDGR